MFQFKTLKLKWNVTLLIWTGSNFSFFAVFFAPVLDLMHSCKPEVRGIAIRAMSLVSRFLSVNKLHHLSAKDVFSISVIDNEKIIGLNCWDKLALWPKR